MAKSCRLGEKRNGEVPWGSVWLTWPMAKRLKLFLDYIFSRENKVQSFFFRVHWLSEMVNI